MGEGRSEMGEAQIIYTSFIIDVDVIDQYNLPGI